MSQQICDLLKRRSVPNPATGSTVANHLRPADADVTAGRRFDDAVVSCAFGCDIHEIYPDDKLAHRIAAKPFEIPYRCLLPKSVRGLLVAGRCISGTHEAHASYRVTGTCMGLGQAAGLAAAMATKARGTTDEIDGRELRGALEQRGVRFL